MYNFIQQQTPGQLLMPDRQNMMPVCPGNGNFQPYVPGYPQNGMIPTPMMPTQPTTPMNPMMPTMPNMPMNPTMPNMPMVPAYPYQGNMGQFGQFGQPGQQGTGGPDFGFEEGPPTLTDIGYTPAYLRTQIGRRVKIEFLLGTDTFIDRDGTLLEVGINYVIIRESDSDDLLLCDMYSIRFVKFYY